MMTMNSQEVAAILEECHRTAAAGQLEPTEEAKGDFYRHREALPADLSTLLQEAAGMKWPFVPEKWQYKRSVASEDKVNLKELINERLPQLLSYLRASILAGEPLWAAAVLFLVDRFLYWTDDSHRLLRIAKALHRCYAATPIAPQVVIRQARVYLNSGKLQKAEYILSKLINNSGATGCWEYHSDSDRILVQAASVQVRGQVLQKLGQWPEAAELIWASLIGFYVLPQPDKKGIGTSLGLLANILLSMNDKDFENFQKSSHIDLLFLGESSHRLLSAAEAAKMAVVYSQYDSLFVLTNVVIQGTCLLSYSFSKKCPSSEKQTFLVQAKEAFEIGLLSKTQGNMVTSKQELHTFVKAAYSLAITHKWLGTPAEVVADAVKACHEAAATFYTYCFAENQNRDSLCTEIMRQVEHVRSLLKVVPFLNSDEGTFIPDSYRAMEERSVPFTLDRFSMVMGRFQKHHASVCEASETSCRKHQGGGKEAPLGPCITAFGTLTETPTTECVTESHGHNGYQGEAEGRQNEEANRGVSYSGKPQEQALPSTLNSEDELQSVNGNNMASRPTRGVKQADRMTKKARTSTSSLSSSLDLSWQKVSFCDAASPKSRESGRNDILANENKFQVVCPTEASEVDGQESSFENMSLRFLVVPIANISNGNQDGNGTNASGQKGINSSLQITSYSQTGNDVGKSHMGPYSTEKLSEMINNQSLIETVEDELESWVDASTGLAEASKVTQSDGLKERQTSSSFSDSFGSQSSWQKLSLCDTGSPVSDRDVITKDTSLAKQGANMLNTDQPISGLDPQSSGLTTTSNRPSAPGQIPSQSRIHCSKSSFENSENQSFEFVELADRVASKATTQCTSTAASTADEHRTPLQPESTPPCNRCFKHCMIGTDVLSELDYKYLLSGVCHNCLINRLPKKKFQLMEQKYNTANSALALKYSRATGLWTARETNVYIGKWMGEKGAQRKAFRVQFLHQEELLGSYMGKEYLKAKEIHAHLSDVERQMTAQYYVTEFNKRLYDKNVTTQIFFIPSEVLLILEVDVIVGCVTVEPYMLGKFEKLTNNTDKVTRHMALDYGIAFGHFTHEFSNGEEVVVDLQGWVTANGKGLMYLTDPQIHNLRKDTPKTKFNERGIKLFMDYQHGSDCNDICKLLSLGKLQQHKSVQQ